MLNNSALNTLRDRGYVATAEINLDDAVSASRELGEVTVDRRSPDLVRRISPQSVASAKQNTLSSRYGIGRFPFHTDAAHWEHPPEFVCLYCENPGGGSRPTELIDTSIWIIEHELRISLMSDVWKTGHYRPRLCTVSDERDGPIRIRYDTGCMEPRGTQSSSTQIEIEHLISMSSRITIGWTSRLLLVINNSRMLHARGSSTRPDPERVLIRILVGGQQ